MRRTERVRILRVIARLNVGGPAVHATLLTERLDPERYESWLVTGTEAPSEGNYLALYERSLDRLVVIPHLGREIRGAADVRSLVALVRLIRKLRPEIVHTHTAKAGALGRLAARVARVPVIVHSYHGHVFHGYFPPGRTRLFLTIERWLARWTDRLLAVSETVRKDLLTYGIGTPERVVVMPLGLDLGRFLHCEMGRGRFRAELGLDDGALLIGTVARLVPVKAHEVFLQAAASIVRMIPESRFVVVGDGERREELRALAERLGIGDRVRFLGWRRDLDRVYADLDLVVLSSRNEGSPVSLIEAMAAARPVVATRVGGVPDVVVDGVTGCLVPPDDSRTMAASIVALLGDTSRRHAMGVAGRERVAYEFSAERLLRDMDRLYADLIRENRADLSA